MVTSCYSTWSQRRGGTLTMKCRSDLGKYQYSLEAGNVPFEEDYSNGQRKGTHCWGRASVSRAYFRSSDYDRPRLRVHRNLSNPRLSQSAEICLTGRIGRVRSPLQGLWGVEWSADSHMAFSRFWASVARVKTPVPPCTVPCLSHCLPQRPLLEGVELKYLIAGRMVR